MGKICYNCGIALTAKTATVEHVPAKNLYEGFSKEYKNNRITVPACYKCNNLFSKIDQELRDVIAVRNDDPDQKKQLTGKGIRSIMRRSNWTNRGYFNEVGQVIAVDFSYEDLRKLHIKNFKALFFKKYSFPVPENYMIDIIAEGDDDKTEHAKFLQSYTRMVVFEHSGHPDIFKFIIRGLTTDDSSDSIHESADFVKLDLIVGDLVYHNEICAIVVAGRKDFVESCKK